MTSKNFSLQRVRTVPASGSQAAGGLLSNKVASQSRERDPFEFNEFSPPKQAVKVDPRKPAAATAAGRDKDKASDLQKQKTMTIDGDATRRLSDIPTSSSSSGKSTIVVGLVPRTKLAPAITDRDKPAAPSGYSVNNRPTSNTIVVAETRPKVITVTKSERPVLPAKMLFPPTVKLQKSDSAGQTAQLKPNIVRSTSANMTSLSMSKSQSNSSSNSVGVHSSSSYTSISNKSSTSYESGSLKVKPQSMSQPESYSFDFDSQFIRPRIAAPTTNSSNRAEPPTKRRALPFRIDSKLFDDSMDEPCPDDCVTETNWNSDADADSGREAFLFTDDFDTADSLDQGTTTSPFEAPTSSNYARPNKEATAANATKPKGFFDFPDDDDFGSKPTHHYGSVVSQPQAGNGAIKVKRAEKPLYTIVRNVQDAQLCEESGEAQSFVDDVEYLLDGLDVSQSASTRALTMMKLAERACQSEFRRSLRAHCFLPRIVSSLLPGAENGALTEAPGWMREDGSLALSCACFLYALSCDRLNVELNVPLLRLFAALVCTDDSERAARITPAEQRTIKRVRELLDQASCSFFESFLPDELSASNLSLDGLLNWIARKDHLDDDWLKRELRQSGVMDRVAALVVADCGYFGETLTCQFSRYMTGSSSADAETGAKRHALEQAIRQRLRRTERCLRLFQLVTYTNRTNQDYLAAYRDGELLSGVARVIQLCTVYVAEFGGELASKSSQNASGSADADGEAEQDDSDSDGDVLLVTNTLLAAIQSVLNLTHTNVKCAVQMGKQTSLIQSIVACACLVPAMISRDEKAFELRLLALGLLVNLVEQSTENETVLLAPDSLPFRNAKLTRILRRATQRSGSDVTAAQRESLRNMEVFNESHSRDNLDLLVALLVEADGLMRTHESEVEQVTDELIRDAEKHASASGNGQRAGVGTGTEASSHSQSQCSSSQSLSASTSNANSQRQMQSQAESGGDGGSEADAATDSQQSTANRSPTKQRGGVTTRLINNKQFIDQAVKKAGRHMEYSMIVAYIALSLGRLLQSNADAASRIRRRLPNRSFDSVIATLFQFQQFMELTFPNSAGSTSVSQVIDLYKLNNI